MRRRVLRTAWTETVRQIFVGKARSIPTITTIIMAFAAQRFHHHVRKIGHEVLELLERDEGDPERNMGEARLQHSCIRGHPHHVS